MLHRCTIPAGWLVILALALVATPTAAQISSKQVRDRYEKQTKGSTKLEDLIKKLDSPDADVRLAGVKALGETKEKKSIPYLIQAAGDPDMRVQAKAIDILGNMRAEDATLVLVQQLFRSDTDPLMKQRILAALGKIGDARAAQPIVEYLRRDLDSPMRGTAIFALGEIGSPESLEPLTQQAQAETDPNLRRLAGEAAAKVRQHQAVLNSEVKEPGKTFLEPKEPPPQQGQQ
jgi:HEAT repeat protein